MHYKNTDSLQSCCGKFETRKRLIETVIEDLVLTYLNLLFSVRLDLLTKALFLIFILNQYLEENGYTEGPNPSPDIVLKEGQTLYMKFRGNIECTSKDPLLSFIFNSNIRAVRDFRVDEKESFAQKGLQCYRGFVQVICKRRL